jgi:hypothetical protein
MFLGAGIGSRQNLLIPASVRAKDRARKFSLRQNLASVHTVNGDSLVWMWQSSLIFGVDARRGIG